MFEKMSSEKERIEEQVHVSDADFCPERIIVIPIDGSQHTDNVLEYATKYVIEKQKDQIVLLHTRAPIYTEMSIELGNPYILANGDILAAETNLRKQSHDLLRVHAMKLLDVGIHVRAISLQGDPREELQHKINTLSPHLVVMGSRGLNQFSKIVLGSVSQHLLHNITVPIMIVPPAKK
jgi:nucleotide-binding universal stress UspA family protein